MCNISCNTCNISDQRNPLALLQALGSPSKNNIRNRERRKQTLTDAKGPRRRVGWGHKVKDKHPPSDTLNCQPSASPLPPLRQKGGEGQQRCRSCKPSTPRWREQVRADFDLTFPLCCGRCRPLQICDDAYVKYNLQSIYDASPRVTLHHVEHLLSADHRPRKTQGKR